MQEGEDGGDLHAALRGWDAMICCTAVSECSGQNGSCSHGGTSLTPYGERDGVVHQLRTIAEGDVAMEGS